ncbi:MAG: spore protease YyaC [Lachnospiraceae bacterium]|nr:spore protease YyaC [Lachnospiraceae bacterium]
MNKNVYYFSCMEETQKHDFSNSLFQMMNCHIRPEMPIIILCIGTDKVTGDSLGPFVGHRLKQLLANVEPDSASRVRVYGTLKEPVHAINLSATLTALQKELAEEEKTLSDCLLLVVDASLGVPHHLGYVTLANQPLSPGEGVNKKLPRVGQISITGIIGEARSSSYKSQMVLRHARLYDLIQLADFISEGIVDSLCRLYVQLSLVYRNGISNGSYPFFLHNANENV